MIAWDHRIVMHHRPDTTTHDGEIHDNAEPSDHSAPTVDTTRKLQGELHIKTQSSWRLSLEHKADLKRAGLWSWSCLKYLLLLKVGVRVVRSRSPIRSAVAAEEMVWRVVGEKGKSREEAREKGKSREEAGEKGKSNKVDGG
ncbi:hypothetical protein BHE74_00058547 [Ensete ventricosum]|nr:hypothetical protein BHE74_00058547 [Ensete ventricosum]